MSLATSQVGVVGGLLGLLGLLGNVVCCIVRWYEVIGARHCAQGHMRLDSSVRWLEWLVGWPRQSASCGLALVVSRPERSFFGPEQRIELTTSRVRSGQFNDLSRSRVIRECCL